MCCCTVASVTRKSLLIIGYDTLEKRLTLLPLSQAALFIFASESLSLLGCLSLGAANEFAAR